MPNKFRTLIYIFLLGLVIAAAGVFYYGMFFADPKKTAETESETIELKIRKDLYDNIAESKNYGDEISPNEPGFGRSNPFSSYK